MNLHRNVVESHELAPLSTVKPHELVLENRLESFVAYLESLRPYVIIPSILVCAKSMMIIDGHHRYHALKALGYDYCPITCLNYSDEAIITHTETTITKKALVAAALSGKLLPPKSSFHHICDQKNEVRPIILLSQLSDMKPF